MNATKRLLTCTCGELKIEAVGKPILGVACYCESCQTAAKQLGFPQQAPLAEPDGGTPFVLYRKDRVVLPASDSLREHRLSPTSTTRRVIATCCDTPLFLEFENGHWVSIYASRFVPHERPGIEMRTMTRDAPPGVEFTDQIPSYSTHGGGFMARLLWTWVLMGFRSPRIEVRSAAG